MNLLPGPVCSYAYLGRATPLALSGGSVECETSLVEVFGLVIWHGGELVDFFLFNPKSCCFTAWITTCTCIWVFVCLEYM